MLAQIRQIILGGNICGKTQLGIKPITIEFPVMSLPIKQERTKVFCQAVIKNGKGKATMIYLSDTIPAHCFVWPLLWQGV